MYVQDGKEEPVSLPVLLVVQEDGENTVDAVEAVEEMVLKCPQSTQVDWYAEAPGDVSDEHRYREGDGFQQVCQDFHSRQKLVHQCRQTVEAEQK